MSASAIARRRAAAASATPSQFGSPFPQQQQQQQQMPPPPPSNNNRMMTLQEVIALVDSRLTNLELASHQQRMFSQQPSPQLENSNDVDLESTISSILEPHLEEFNHRYEILATEILNIKNVVMKLQSYTLDVNKMLVDERIRVLADPLLEDDALAAAAVDESSSSLSNNNDDEGKEVELAASPPVVVDDAAVTYTLDDAAIIQPEEVEVVPSETPAKKPRKKRNVLSI